VEQYPWTAIDDFWIYKNRPDIKPSMADSLNAIIADTPNSLLELAVAAPSIFATATYGKRELTNVYLMGTTDAYAAITPINCREGRFIDQFESRGGRYVCVIGTDVAQGLFGGDYPIGKKIQIGEQEYEVVGVF